MDCGPQAACFESPTVILRSSRADHTVDLPPQAARRCGRQIASLHSILTTLAALKSRPRTAAPEEIARLLMGWGLQDGSRDYRCPPGHLQRTQGASHLTWLCGRTCLFNRTSAVTQRPRQLPVLISGDHETSPVMTSES